MNRTVKLLPLPSASRRARQKGATMVLLTVMIALLVIPILGLAIDGSIALWMRTRLAAAVDASAIAAARSFSVGSTLAAQTASATTTANQYFAANFQPGVMGTSILSTGGNPVVNITTSSSLITVSVQAQARVPLYFLRMLGYNTATIGANGQAKRRVTNVIMVLDRSYSMQLANACGTLATAASNFLNFFVEGTDRIGLVTFQSTANLDYPPSTTFKSQISSKLSSMVCTGYTTTSEGLYQGYAALKSINQPGALNVIVLFTDGIPDSIYGTFPVKTVADYRDGYDTNINNALAYNPGGGSGSAPYVPESNVAASTCSSSYNSTGLTGIVLDVTGAGYTVGGASPTTGPTGGVFDPTGIPISSSNADYLWPNTIAATGCKFSASPSYPTLPFLAMRADVAYIPTTGAHNISFSGYKTVDACETTPSANYYYGVHQSPCYRVDVPHAVSNAAWNAADNIANTIRSDSTYTPYIYTIGLGGTTYQSVDATLLERIANDQRAVGYNSSQNQGLYIYSTSGTLGTAFAQIASQVLHLTQ